MQILDIQSVVSANAPISSRVQSVWLVAGSLLCLVLGLSCTGPAPGEFGTFRLAGRAKGAAPLKLLPPVTDRAGNAYILYGGGDVPETAVFAGKNSGGWSSGCALTKGDAYGAHGWVGYTANRQWYWSGDALVSVSGQSGDCHRVLDHDPGTDANLLFRAVLPWVHDAPSRRTLVTLVQSPVDLLPFSARVDLEAELLTNVNPFEPAAATDLKVLGVGAERERGEGVVLLQYVLADETRTEARFYDAEARLTATTRLPLDPQPREYTARGFLQMTSAGLVAGLLEGERLAAFDRNGGRVKQVTGMTPVGVHKWQDTLYVVGTADGHPVIAPIDEAAGTGRPQIWEASEVAAVNLSAPIDVRDDRQLPSTSTTFARPRTAIGAFPFVHEHSPIEHARGTTLWLVAGPTFDTGGASVTAFAMAPVGISYP
jgi:hypothetical protein